MTADSIRIERRGAAQARRRRRLLLVDDDAWCRGIADGVLRGNGYRVLCTGDAGTAVSIAREMLPDLVLADVGLALIEPVPAQQRRRGEGAVLEPPIRAANGYAILRPLGTSPVLASPPVVLAGDRQESGREPLRFDIPDHVAKPISPQVLLDKVARCLPRRGSDASGAGGSTTSPARVREAVRADLGEVIMEGTIDTIGVVAVLEVFHSNQLTGVCALLAGSASAEVGFEDGEVVHAMTSDGRLGAEAVFEILSWSSGRFAFGLARPTRTARVETRFEKLILEGMRRFDEGRRSSGRRARR
jgi:CheY-like chemotaxis protein